MVRNLGSAEPLTTNSPSYFIARSHEAAVLKIGFDCCFSHVKLSFQDKATKAKSITLAYMKSMYMKPLKTVKI